jgi:hypothetical protein
LVAITGTDARGARNSSADSGQARDGCSTATTRDAALAGAVRLRVGMKSAAAHPAAENPTPTHSAWVNPSMNTRGEW